MSAKKARELIVSTSIMKITRRMPKPTSIDLKPLLMESSPNLRADGAFFDDGHRRLQITRVENVR